MFSAFVSSIANEKSKRWLAFFVPILCCIFAISSLNEHSYNIGGWDSKYGISIAPTVNSLLVVCAISIVAFMCKREQCSVFSFAILFGNIGLVLTGDIFNAYVFLEIISISTVIVIYKSDESHCNAFEYLISSTISGTFFLMGVILIHQKTGSLNIDIITKYLSSHIQEVQIILGEGMIVTGLMVKSLVFPMNRAFECMYKKFSFGLLKYLLPIGSKCCLYLLLRFIYLTVDYGVLVRHQYVCMLLLMMLSIGIVIYSIAALRSDDINHIVIYSSIVQSCYVVMCPILGGSFVLARNFLLIDIISKVILISIFYVARMRCSSADVVQSSRFLSRIEFMCVCLCMSNLIGIPGFAGFALKWELMSRVVAFPNIIMCTTVILAICFASVAMIWILYRIIKGFIMRVDMLPEKMSVIRFEQCMMSLILLISVIFV